MEDIESDYNDRAFNRLFSKTEIQENGCWNFIGSIDQTGYGRLRYKGRQCLVHRLSYFLCKGDIPQGFCVLHSCDNTRCINPDHLSIGTQEDNVRDMLNKHGHPFGNYKHGKFANVKI